MMKFWKMREKEMPEEQRQLGLYLTYIISIMMLFGIAGGLAISQTPPLRFLTTFLLIAAMCIGYSILVAFTAARVIYEECIKGGCKR